MICKRVMLSLAAGVVAISALGYSPKANAAVYTIYADGYAWVYSCAPGAAPPRSGGPPPDGCFLLGMYKTIDPNL